MKMAKRRGKESILHPPSILVAARPSPIATYLANASNTLP